MTDVVTGADGRTLSRRGVETRGRLLDAAEQVFGELGYHDASIVKITEVARRPPTRSPSATSRGWFSAPSRGPRSAG